MTESEQKVFQLIQQDPFISQQQLAEKIGLSRSAIANIISSLVRKKYLLGKAYVLNKPSSIVCIGAANVDKKIKTTEKLSPYTSNPVNSSVSIGGVVRNVAENLGRLGRDVTLLSVVGNDSEWQYIKKLSEPFMNLDHVHVLENQTTGTYTALLDSDGEMYLGLADMSIYDLLLPEILMNEMYLLKNSRCVVMDMNCPSSTIEFICNYTKKENIPLVLIAVSEPKMERLPHDLSAVSCLVINKGESETFFKQKTSTKEELKTLNEKWLSLGVSEVVMTAGTKEVIVTNKNGTNFYPVKKIDSNHIIDVTGAGDSFSAAYIDSWIDNENERISILAGLTNAYHTIQSASTVRQNLTKINLKNEMENY